MADPKTPFPSTTGSPSTYNGDSATQNDLQITHDSPRKPSQDQINISKAPPPNSPNPVPISPNSTQALDHLSASPPKPNATSPKQAFPTSNLHRNPSTSTHSSTSSDSTTANLIPPLIDPTKYPPKSKTKPKNKKKKKENKCEDEEGKKDQPSRLKELSSKGYFIHF